MDDARAEGRPEDHVGAAVQPVSALDLLWLTRPRVSPAPGSRGRLPHLSESGETSAPLSRTYPAGAEPPGSPRATPRGIGAGRLGSGTEAAASSPSPDGAAAEEERLGVGEFRAGLMKRGLTELLELHLLDFPPADETEALLMLRDIKLAEYVDESRDRRERFAAVMEANRFLLDVIRQNPADPRRFEWRWALAHSLIYDEAEPYIGNILYRGGTQVDRDALGLRMARAVSELRILLDQLRAEYDRIDGMSIGEFERLEATGRLEQLDRLSPRAEYLLLWALFYDALARDDDDAVRVQHLQEIVSYFREQPALLETSHELSRVQVPALTLRGMVHRRLEQHARARSDLSRALSVAESLEDPDERNRVAWAVALAQIERIRNERDDGRFEDALAAVDTYRKSLAQRPSESVPDEAEVSETPFGFQIVAALEERSIYQHRAAAAQAAGRHDDARRDRRLAWTALARLADRHPQRRDEIYATLNKAIPPDASLEQLDPIEGAAWLAGLLLESQERRDRGQDATAILQRAAALGEQWLATVATDAESLVPEVLYNLGVARYRLGDTRQSAEAFLKVAGQHSNFRHARSAATFAVQLAAELYEEEALRDHAEVVQLYRNALQVLLTNYRDSEAARHWRFYYAQVLQEIGELRAAAVEYARVVSVHPYYLEAVYARAHCLAALLRTPVDEGFDPAERKRVLNDLFDTLRGFHSLLTHEIEAGRAENDTQSRRSVSALRQMLASSRVMTAEHRLDPQSDQPAVALVTLSGFEDEFPELTSSGLMARVWRVRLLAYQQLEQVEEAARAIPRFIQTEPAKALDTIQQLYVSLAEEVDSLRVDSRSVPDDSTRNKAEMALMLAEQLVEGTRSRLPPTGMSREMLALQLAEANLRAERLKKARDLFEPLCPMRDADAESSKGARRSENAGPIQTRACNGYAETLFQLEQYEAALPLFNRLAMGLAPEDPVRWRALLRDLQCRTMLDHPPEGIVRVILQQRELFPDLGGKALAEQFDRLQRHNERRLNRGSQE